MTGGCNKFIRKSKYEFVAIVNVILSWEQNDALGAIFRIILVKLQVNWDFVYGSSHTVSTLITDVWKVGAFLGCLQMHLYILGICK